MKLKSVDNYFEAARQMPLLVSIEQVQKIVESKGVTPPPKKSGWNLNSIIMTATTLLIASISVWLWNSSNENLANEKNNISNHQEELSNNLDPKVEKPIVLQLLDTNEVGLTLAPVEEVKIHEIEIQKLDSQKAESSSKAEKFKSKNTGSAWWPNSNELKVNEGEAFEFEKEETPKLIAKDSSDKKAGETRLLSKTILLEGEEWFKLKNVNGDIIIKTWDKPQVKMDVEVSLKAKSDEEEQLLLDDFDLNFVRKKDKIEVERKWDKFTDDGCNCQLAGVKVKTDLGEKIKIKSITVDYVITLPANLNLDLKNNYGEIKFPAVKGDVVLSVFQGKLRGGKIGGDLKISAKYSAVILEDFENGEVDLYQSSLNAGVSKNLNLKAKYSKVELEKTSDLKFYGYQSNLKTKADMNTFSGDLKYGKFESTGDIGSVELDMYQSKFFAQNIDSLEISSSYSTTGLNDVGVVKITKSFQDKFKFVSINSFNGKSQYSTLDIGTLKGELNFISFQGKLVIKEVKNTFTLIDIESKYTPVSLKFENDSKYNLNAKTAYSKVSFPENGFTVSYRDRHNQNLTLKGAYNSEITGKTSLVNLDSFQGNLDLK